MNAAAPVWAALVFLMAAWLAAYRWLCRRDDRCPAGGYGGPVAVPAVAGGRVIAVPPLVPGHLVPGHLCAMGPVSPADALDVLAAEITARVAEPEPDLAPGASTPAPALPPWVRAILGAPTTAEAVDMIWLEAAHG